MRTAVLLPLADRRTGLSSALPFRAKSGVPDRQLQVFLTDCGVQLP
jgi:hypothetical protein